MKIDDLSITELSRLLRKSRPTIYKYITDYKDKRFDNIPNSIKELFDRIESGCARSDVYTYCESNYFYDNLKSVEIKQVINLIIENGQSIDLDKLKNYILGEIENGKRTNG